MMPRQASVEHLLGLLTFIDMEAAHRLKCRLDWPTVWIERQQLAATLLGIGNSRGKEKLLQPVLAIGITPVGCG